MKNLNIQTYSFYMTVTHNEIATRKTLFWSYAHSQFSLHLNKEASTCRYKIMTFRHKISFIINSFVASLDITVMINCLQELMKILNEKMLKAINLY